MACPKSPSSALSGPKAVFLELLGQALLPNAWKVTLFLMNGYSCSGNQPSPYRKTLVLDFEEQGENMYHDLKYKREKKKMVWLVLKSEIEWKVESFQLKWVFVSCWGIFPEVHVFRPKVLFPLLSLQD